ncbi:presequence protease 1, chloroplastic/mitochondrial-like isoform X3 [Ananas comosus]|uniref:Presequence protease 1, chloroplastic/mitochondrial-like isoform X3 n=1 Tax=Ananas comosus TaxID=4615 RepID=A0A6P5EHQ8_ANACO|nr:presequence protease 1, chloroplastic/mitochondrial-like isoform X3 [Ananas comosus]
METPLGSEKAKGLAVDFRKVNDAYDVAEELGFEKLSEKAIKEYYSHAVLYRHKKTGAEIMSLSNSDENKAFGIVFSTPPRDSSGEPHIFEHSVLCGSRKYPVKEPFVELLKGSFYTYLNAFTCPDRTCYPVASTNVKDFYNLVDVYLDAVFFPKCVEDIQIFQQEGWHYELNDPAEDISIKGVVYSEMKGNYSQPDLLVQYVARKALFPDTIYSLDSGGDPKVIPQLTFEQFKEYHNKYYKPSNAKIWFYGDDDPNERLRILAASSLRKILLESGLGDDIIGNGIEDEYPQHIFAVGMKGLSKDDVRKVEELIVKTFKSLAEEGFKLDAVEASMNTIEFSLRENNSGSFPRGLSLMLRSINKWIYGKDPFEPLLYEEPLLNLKSYISREGPKAVFSPLIEKFFLNNSHCVTVEMEPDPDKASRDEADQNELLKKLKASMTEEEVAELARATKELRLKQETPDSPEALRCIPKLSLEDIPKKPIHIPTTIEDVNGVKVLKHNLFTNNIVYLEVVFDMSPLKQELLQLVPLFCQCLLEMGTKDMDFVQLNHLIGRKTGGIDICPFVASKIGKKSDLCSYIIVHGKALSERVEDLFNLINCILQEVEFKEKQRFKQFVAQSRAEMETQIKGSGSSIAATRINAKLNVAGWIDEQISGISYLEFLQNLEKKVDDDWDKISISLEEIRKSLLSRNGCIINMTSDKENLMAATKYLSNFVDSLPTTFAVNTSWESVLSPGNEAIVIPTQVNYVVKAANIYESGYQFHGSVYVISNYVDTTWLWDRLRTSGGAYGGECGLNAHSGVFSYSSYRDPNLLKTLDVYDGTANFLRELELDDDSLTKAIIGAIRDLEGYQLPDAKGYSSLLWYLTGVTEEYREKRHEEVLSTIVKDFKEFADAIEAVKDKWVVVAVASPSDVALANEQRPGFFDVKKIREVS